MRRGRGEKVSGGSGVIICEGKGKGGSCEFDDLII